MNWSRLVGFIMSALCLACAAAFAYQRDWRKTIYWLLAAAINVTMSY